MLGAQKMLRICCAPLARDVHLAIGFVVRLGSGIVLRGLVEILIFPSQLLGGTYEPHKMLGAPLPRHGPEVPQEIVTTAYSTNMDTLVEACCGRRPQRENRPLLSSQPAVKEPSGNHLPRC